MTKSIKHSFTRVLIGVITLMGIATLAHVTTISAKAASFKTKTYSSVPKPFIGTWYHYSKRGGLEKLTIKKHTVTWRYKGKSSTVPNVGVEAYSKKGRTTLYNIASKNYGSAGMPFFFYNMKINGKKHRVLVVPTQTSEYKPEVFTRFKVKHDYRTPMSAQNQLA